MLDQHIQENCIIGAGVVTEFPPGDEGQGQEFIPTRSSLMSVALQLQPFNSPLSDIFTVSVHEDTVAGPVIATTSSSVQAPGCPVFWQRFTFPLPVGVTPGRLYVIQVGVTNLSFGWTYAQTNLDPACEYSGGTAIFNGSSYSLVDRSFRTYGVE